MIARLIQKLLKLLRDDIPKAHGRPISPRIENTSSRNPNLIVQDFEIWHTYTTYFEGPLDDLSSAAEHLVKSHVAIAAILTDGRTIWRGSGDNAEMGFGLTTFAHELGSKSTAQFDSGKNAPPLDGFALEAWAHACKFLFAEENLFLKDVDVTPPAARAYLGACMLGNEDYGRIWLYPIVNLYESGVIILHLRLLAGEQPTSLDTLIEDFVNLSKRSFQLGAVPPAIAKLAPRSDHVGYNPSHASRNPLTRWRLGRNHDREIDKLTWTHDGGDFTWSLAPLSRSAMEEGETMAGLAHAIFDVIGLLVGRKRKLSRHHWMPQRALVKGNYWVGRPYVHLVRYSDQQVTATGNERRHALAFAKLIMKTTTPAHRNRTLAHLPEDMRMFEDANTYLTRGLGLFAWSGQGLFQHGTTHFERNSYIIESQVKAEVAEHAYMLARALYDSSDQTAEADRVFDLRARLLRLQAALTSPSYYGEITDLIRQALTAFGFDALVASTRDRIALREAKTAYLERRGDERSRRALTLLFGLVAASVLGETVVKPLWTILGWATPAPDAAASLIYAGLAALFILLIALVVVGVSQRRP